MGTSKIGDNMVDHGDPVTKKITHYYPSRWTRASMVTISDGSSMAHWQVSNIGRMALIG